MKKMILFFSIAHIKLCVFSYFQFFVMSTKYEWVFLGFLFRQQGQPGYVGANLRLPKDVIFSKHSALMKKGVFY